MFLPELLKISLELINCRDKAPTKLKATMEILLPASKLQQKEGERVKKIKGVFKKTQLMSSQFT